MKKLITSSPFKGITINLSPPVTLALSFLIMIVVGTFLLKFPISTVNPVTWMEALFTATSAVTVTGLVVVDTGTAFTVFGQVVIMGLMQFGGLGLMAFATLMFLVLRRRIGLQHRILIQESLNQTSLGGLVRLVRYLLMFTFGVELIGFLILSLRWVPLYGWGQGLYYSLFHTIAAFNNAGFSLWADSLNRFVGDPVVNLAITGMFIIGGLGFTVLLDIQEKKKFKKLSLHSKVMLVGTVVVNVVAVLLIFGLEYSNPETLGGLPLSDKIWGAYFQGVTPRTAGFNSVDTGAMTTPSLLLTLLLMFIGAGSASTSSGIKLSTFIILILATYSFLRGRREASIFHKRIKPDAIVRALTITMLSFVLVFVAVFVLTITEDASFMAIIFEVVSAFGTVGLSTGLTADLSPIGKFIIMGMMFSGRIGSLTVATILARKTELSLVRYPEEDVLLG